MTILPNNRSTFHVWGWEYDFNVHCSSFSKWCIAVFIWLGRALKSSWYFMTFWGQKGAMKKAQDVSMKFSKSIVSLLCPFPKLLPAPFRMTGRFRAVRWIRHSDMTCNVSEKMRSPWNVEMNSNIVILPSITTKGLIYQYQTIHACTLISIYFNSYI